MKNTITEYGTYTGKHPNLFLTKCIIKKIIKGILYPFIYLYYIYRFKNIWNLKKYIKDKNINKGLLLSFYKNIIYFAFPYLGIKSEFSDIPCLPHGIHGLFVSEHASIGKNCVIFQQVTIGSNMIKDSKTFGSPKIGNNVYIGAGAKIIGNITIGDNCRIGANTVVVKSMKPNTVAVASETRIIESKKELDNNYYLQGKNGLLIYEDGTFKKVK